MLSVQSISEPRPAQRRHLAAPSSKDFVFGSQNLGFPFYEQSVTQICASCRSNQSLEPCISLARQFGAFPDTNYSIPFWHDVSLLYHELYLQAACPNSPVFPGAGANAWDRIMLKKILELTARQSLGRTATLLCISSYSLNSYYPP